MSFSVPDVCSPVALASVAGDITGIMVVMTFMAITVVMDIMAAMVVLINSSAGFAFDYLCHQRKEDTNSLFSESILFVSL